MSPDGARLAGGVAACLVLLAAGVCAQAREGEAALSETAIEERIVKYRTAEVTLKVTDTSGRPLTDTQVTVQMLRHKFLFGSNIFRLRPEGTNEDDRAYGERFAELLNYATLPFYWQMYEPAEGKTNAVQVKAMARWCKERGIRTKGHPLVWTLEPAWVGEKPAAEATALLWGRVTRDVTDFAGLTDIWDVVNEAVVGPDQARARNARTLLGLYEREGRVAVVARAFAVAREANPKATLVLNDFRTDEAYEKILEEALAKGVSIDVIGIQSHMHGGYWGAAKAWEVCERFARFGKPLHFTELTILSGEPVGEIDWENRRRNQWRTSPELEQRQERQAAEFYRVLFSHPAVAAVTWWDFSDQRSWMGAPAGFLREDMSPKPVFLALKKLIHEDWWTGPLTLRTDDKGTVTFKGFLGEYAAGAPGGSGTFRIDAAGAQSLAVSLSPTR